MTPDEINRYIGLEWAAGARGPSAYDCWGLLRQVQAEHFQIEIPDVPEFGDVARDLYRERVESRSWEIAPAPFHGAGVLLRGGNEPHVGIWLECEGGGVLHSMERIGVIWSPRAALRLLGFSRLTFYKFNV